MNTKESALKKYEIKLKRQRQKFKQKKAKYIFEKNDKNLFKNTLHLSWAMNFGIIQTIDVNSKQLFFDSVTFITTGLFLVQGMITYF